jgi:Fe2+ or Zn2+ uptake regulation protein
VDKRYLPIFAPGCIIALSIANGLQQGNIAVQETIRRLHAQGGRMTLQRRKILDTLETMKGHPTAEELYEIVRKQMPGLHLSTVYRTLRWLEQEGKVSARRFEEDSRQERFDYTHPSEHHHFQCTKCKKVIEFDNPLVNAAREKFEAQFEARVESVSLIFYGLCTYCYSQAIDRK